MIRDRSHGKFMLIALLLLVVTAACADHAADHIPPAAEGADGYDAKAQLAALERVADQIYAAAGEDDVNLVRDKLDQYTRQMTKIAYAGITGAEGLNALTRTLIETKETFNRVRFSRQDGLVAAIRLRLVTDALSRRNEPMWLEYRQLLGRDADGLTAAVQSGNAVQALHALRGLHGHYRIIRPAALVSRHPSIVEKTDSLLSFLMNELSAERPDFDRINAGVAHLRPVLDELFGNNDAETSGPPMIRQQPTMWTGILTVVIVTVLAYVGWRKYNAEKRYSLRRPRD